MTEPLARPPESEPELAASAASAGIGLPTGVLDGRDLLVVGGRQRAERPIWDLSSRWYGYGAGVVIGLHDQRAQVELTYTSPPGTCLPEDPILFKSATVRGERLYACTQTEVMVFALPGYEMLHHISLPWFNDVHHVVPGPTGSLFVANSGLEMVAEISPAGELLAAWNVLGGEAWAAVEPDRDYRLGVDLKPHRAHPNYVFFVGDEPWATRFELRDAISLTNPERRIDVGVERIHDGVVHDGAIYFTSVNGCVVEVDADTLAVERVTPLAHAGADEAILGWCRGLCVAGDDMWVGFSRIRYTKFRERVSFVRTGGLRSLPTRIARYRRSDWACLGEIDLEPLGLHAVFTVADRSA